MDWINLTQDRDKHSCRWEDNIKMDIQGIGWPVPAAARSKA